MGETHPRDRSDSKETDPAAVTNTVSKKSPARVGAKLLARSQRKAPEGQDARAGTMDLKSDREQIQDQKDMNSPISRQLDHELRCKQYLVANGYGT